jgi:hypothetical protein
MFFRRLIDGAGTHTHTQAETHCPIGTLCLCSMTVRLRARVSDRTGAICSTARRWAAAGRLLDAVRLVVVVGVADDARLGSCFDASAGTCRVRCSSLCRSRAVAFLALTIR